MSALARLVLITDPAFSAAHTDDVIASVAFALPRGALAVQLRDKTARAEAFAARARHLRELTSSLGAQLIVNGPADLARAIGADGVHLPAHTSIADARRVLGAETLLTSAAHDDDDVRRALAEGADGVLVSPIFATPGKGPARGVDALRRASAIARSSPSPRRSLLVFALGGVDSQNAKSCFEAGADGVAVIRALLGAAATDPAAIASAILDDRGAGLC